MRSIPLIVLVLLAIAAIAWAITLTASMVWSYWASGLWCAIVIGIRELPSQRGGFADNNAQALSQAFPVDLPERSSSRVTATAAFADSRTFSPSTSATSARSMKR